MRRPCAASNKARELVSECQCSAGGLHVWTMDRPAVFGPAKDRPVLFTAAAWAQVLLTLDSGDFGAVMGTGFYGLDVIMPGNFLERERAAGRLKKGTLF